MYVCTYIQISKTEQGTQKMPEFVCTFWKRFQRMFVEIQECQEDLLRSRNFLTHFLLIQEKLTNSTSIQTNFEI